MLVDVLEVVLLTTRARDGKTEFEPHAKTAAGQKATNNPKEDADTDRAGSLENSGRGREDTSTNHLVENQEDGTSDADLAVVAIGEFLSCLDLTNDGTLIVADRHRGGLDSLRVGGLVKGTHNVCCCPSALIGLLTIWLMMME